jgi:RNA polymerase sigma-70 factor (ECF subfamily)
MEQTLVAEAKEAPREADLAFDRLYRSSRDDVYAYVAGLLRDPTAAEEVTAAAFERAYRKRSRFDPRRGEPSGASPSPPRWSYCNRLSAS